MSSPAYFLQPYGSTWYGLAWGPKNTFTREASFSLSHTSSKIRNPTFAVAPTKSGQSLNSYSGNSDTASGWSCVDRSSTASKLGISENSQAWARLRQNIDASFADKVDFVFATFEGNNYVPGSDFCRRMRSSGFSLVDPAREAPRALFFSAADHS